jgi:hypothetical protein
MRIDEISRKTYATLDAKPNLQEIQTGCLQRIADATELMAGNYQNLLNERDKYLRWYEEEKAQTARLLHQIAGLRGTITRMKKARRRGG